ncbi:MAG: TonB family protein [Synergistaceae bacterium]|nr:TonB family protein [Synergistaceae bacterium]
MTHRDERRVWVFAFAASVIFHAALLLVMPSFSRSHQPPIMTVRLTTAPVVGDAAPGPISPAKDTAPAAPKKAVSVKKEKPQSKINKTRKIAESAKATEISSVPSDAPVEASDNGGSANGAAGGVQDGAGIGSVSGTGGGGGGGLVDVGTLRITKKVIPDYPAFSRKRREEGTVKIIITIDNGAVSHAEIERSCGHERLDASAMRAVKRWRFDYSGTIRARVPMTFRLEN